MTFPANKPLNMVRSPEMKNLGLYLLKMTTDTIKEVKVTPLYEKTLDCPARTVVNVGGSGSSKSHTIAQLLIEKLFSEHNKQFVITRKTMPALKRSSYGLIIQLLKEYGLYDRGIHNHQLEVSPIFWLHDL